MKLETVTELDLHEAKFPRRKSYSLILKPTESKAKHKGVQDNNDYTLEVYKNCLEENEIDYAANFSIRSNRHEISLATQKKIALNTFDDGTCFNNKYISIPWGYKPENRE